MAYPSSGEAAAVGFERGVAISRGMRQDEERRQDREEDRGLRRKQIENAEEERKFQRKRQERVDTQTEEDRALSALDAEVTSARDAFGGLYQAWKADEQNVDLRKRAFDAGRQLEELGGRRRALRTKRLAPIWEQAQDESRALLDDLKMRRKAPQDVPEPELYRAMSVALKRPVSELFRGEDGSPSQLGMAADQLVEAMQSGDERTMLRAANVVFAPELAVGVGEIGKGGAEVIRKEIVAARADPRGNGRVMPTLRVTVRTPDGREIPYNAPITEGRSASGDDDRVASLDVGEVLDHVARLQAAEKVVNGAEAAPYLRRGEAEAMPQVARYLEAFHAAGGKPFESKARTETIDLGDRKLRIKTEPSGKETREELRTGLPPRAELDADTRYAIAELRALRAAGGAGGGTAGAEEKRLRIIRDYAKKNNLSEAEAAKKLRELSVLGVQSPEERAEGEARRAATTAAERDTAAAQRQAPGTAPSQVRIETEMKAKALRANLVPAGHKLGKYVPGKGLEVLDSKGKQAGWIRE